MERVRLDRIRNTLVISWLALSGCVAKTPEPDIKTPTATEISFPTPSAEEIARLESSIQSQLDEAFPDFNLHDTSLEGNGFLVDFTGNQYALFETQYPAFGTGFDLKLLLVSQVGENGNIVWVKGLVLDEEGTTDQIRQFKAVSYDSVNKSLVLENPILRTEKGGMIEIFDGEAWKELTGNLETQEQLFARLEAHTLSVPAPTATPVPTETPIPTETPVPTPTPNYVELGKNLPGVVAIEQRNGKWVGVNEQGLSIYWYDEEIKSFDEIELITPQDITDEDRLYDRDRGQGRVKFPFGFYPSNLETGVEGFKSYVLYGVLLEEPYYLEDKRLFVYTIGIPRGNEFLVLQVFGGVSEYQQYPVSIVAEKIPQSPAGGFTFTWASLDLIPVTEAAEVLGRGVGRQIALDLTFYESPEEQIGSLDWYMETGGPANDCKENCAIGIREMKKHLDETYETIGYLRNNDPRYDGGKIYGMYATARVPMPLRE